VDNGYLGFRGRRIHLHVSRSTCEARKRLAKRAQGRWGQEPVI